MAITNHERVGKMLDLLRSGLGPFAEREFRNVYADQVEERIAQVLGDDRINNGKPMAEWDVAVLLKLMWDSWNAVFRLTLGHSERSLVSEMRAHRNRWAHQEAFSSDDTYRAMDSACNPYLAYALLLNAGLDGIEPIRDARPGDVVRHAGALEHPGAHRALLVAARFGKPAEADQEEGDRAQNRDEHDRQDPGDRCGGLASQRDDHRGDESEDDVCAQCKQPDDLRRGHCRSSSACLCRTLPHL